MKKNKYLFELLFFIHVMFGGICNAQCQGEDSLYFCPHGNYRILKIEKVGKSSKIKNRGKEYEFSNVGSLYIIYAKKMKDIFFNSEMDSDTIRILSIKNTRKKNGKKLKKNNVYFFNLVSIYWKVTELADMLSHVNNEGFFYKGYYINRLKDEDIEQIYEAEQLDGLNYNFFR